MSFKFEIRHPTGSVFDHLESILPATACTSIVVSSEILYGVRKSPSKKLKQQAVRVTLILPRLRNVRAGL
jgi:predicted nucleic acid-binding protein